MKFRNRIRRLIHLRKLDKSKPPTAIRAHVANHATRPHLPARLKQPSQHQLIDAIRYILHVQIRMRLHHRHRGRPPTRRPRASTTAPRRRRPVAVSILLASPRAVERPAPIVATRHDIPRRRTREHRRRRRRRHRVSIDTTAVHRHRLHRRRRRRRARESNRFNPPDAPRGSRIFRANARCEILSLARAAPRANATATLVTR